VNNAYVGIETCFMAMHDAIVCESQGGHYSGGKSRGDINSRIHYRF